MLTDEDGSHSHPRTYAHTRHEYSLVPLFSDVQACSNLPCSSCGYDKMNEVNAGGEKGNDDVLQPSGCPMAMAPPFTFTLSNGIPSLLTQYTACDAKASLIS